MGGKHFFSQRRKGAKTAKKTMRRTSDVELDATPSFFSSLRPLPLCAFAR
jgi:hypothetical protein